MASEEFHKRKPGLFDHYLLERFGINATFNSGAMKWQGKYVLYLFMTALNDVSKVILLRKLFEIFVY